MDHRERESVLQQGVARSVLVALWLGIAASPLLLLVGGVTRALVGGWLAERVRLRHVLLAFYARLMNNPELNR
ncbi:hypothetical protein ACET7H_01200 [Aeromonas veronii]